LCEHDVAVNVPVGEAVSSNYPPWKSKLHRVIFEADTPAGRGFDIALLFAILLSVLAVSLESVPGIDRRYGPVLRAVEWLFTALFSVEYLLRLLAVRSPFRYAHSFFGLVDLLAVLPAYVSLALPGAQSLAVIRALRLIRVFRILKLVEYVGESQVLWNAIRASARKITVFVFIVLTIVLIVAALMYVIEGEGSGFTSIPESIYWAIVTLSTVGYGDIAPVTPLGKTLASFLMILGYGIIAVPTGIVTVELAGARKSEVTTQACPHCSRYGHDADAVHCKYCGAALE
jgi:voltage-gated potassium channel